MTSPLWEIFPFYDRGSVSLCDAVGPHFSKDKVTFALDSAKGFLTCVRVFFFFFVYFFFVFRKRGRWPCVVSIFFFQKVKNTCSYRFGFLCFGEVLLFWFFCFVFINHRSYHFSETLEMFQFQLFSFSHSKWLVLTCAMLFREFIHNSINYLSKSGGIDGKSIEYSRVGRMLIIVSVYLWRFPCDFFPPISPRLG